MNKPFPFDEIVYLTVEQTVLDNISARRFEYKKSILDDEVIKKEKLEDIYKEIIDNDDICYSLEKEIQFVKDNHSDKSEIFENTIWRNIQHYPVEEQKIWFENHSNYRKVKDKFPIKVVKLPVSNLRDEKEIAKQLSKWANEFFKKQDSDTQYIINISLGTNETQVVWYIMAENELLPAHTKFIKTYDNKNEAKKNRRFKNFSIKEVPLFLISKIGPIFKSYSDTKSSSRELVNKLMTHFLGSGFAILLIGERGVGKSHIITEVVKKQEKQEYKVVQANCASFAEDTMAESELFGYKKGAFTGATKDTPGLIKEAENGILFLDEIHSLSKRVQEKLMKSFQTDEKNSMHIRPFGATEEEEVKNVKLIFATNKEISELRECLLPDFYDRIVQFVIRIPPLRETRDDLEKDWKGIWTNLKFDEGKKKSPVPMESELISWLKELPLYGNYRDLQKIAMYYHIFTEFEDGLSELLPKNEKTPLQYAKNQYEEYCSGNSANIEKYNFDTKKNTKNMIIDYKYELQNWAVNKFGGVKNTIDHFKKLGDSITAKTLNNWKNKRG